MVLLSPTKIATAIVSNVASNILTKVNPYTKRASPSKMYFEISPIFVFAFAYKIFISEIIIAPMLVHNATVYSPKK